MNYNNLAQRTNFIAGSDKFDNLPFFLTNVNIPGLNLAHPEISSRWSTHMKGSADTLTFNSLSIEMLIDEDFLIYQEFMDVIDSNINLEDGTFTDFYFNFFIEINNSKGNKVLKIDFENCRIESISDISLDSQDEASEYVMNVDMIYDSFSIEQSRVFTSLDSVPSTPDVPIVQNEYLENFTDLTDWVLWGFPTPILTSDAGATNGQGFDSNGAGAYESGGVQNTLEIPVGNPFEFIFKVKQPLSTDANTNLYLIFGITEGIGISSTSNGRTGSTIMGVKLQGGLDSDSSIKQITYQFKKTEPESEADYSNDGQYHEFKFQYTPGSSNALYKIYKDDVLAASATKAISNHDNLYLFIQGKSEDGIQVVDTIEGTYGEV